jgi:hypothetical protein
VATSNYHWASGDRTSFMWVARSGLRKIQNMSCVLVESWGRGIPGGRPGTIKDRATRACPRVGQQDLKSSAQKEVGPKFSELAGGVWVQFSKL